jgi:hypothetical protein
MGRHLILRVSAEHCTFWQNSVEWHDCAMRGQITHYSPTGRPEVTSEPLVIALVYPARTIPAIDEGSFARPD